MEPASNTGKSTREEVALIPDSIRQNKDKISFLDLAAEIRNQIYECVVEGKFAGLSRKGKLTFASSGLCMVSKQIREEFTTIPDIALHVKDFDFRHVVTFMNRLSPSRFKQLLEKEGVAVKDQKLELLLDFKIPTRVRNNATLIGDEKLLMRWVNRMEVPQKRGVTLDIKYRVNEVSLMGLVPLMHQLQRLCSLPQYLNTWTPYLHPSTMELAPKQGRKFDELRKILAAVEELYRQGVEEQIRSNIGWFEGTLDQRRVVGTPGEAWDHEGHPARMVFRGGTWSWQTLE